MKTEFEKSGENAFILHKEYMQRLPFIAQTGMKPILMHLSNIAELDKKAGGNITNAEEVYESLKHAQNKNGEALFDDETMKKLSLLGGGFPDKAQLEVLEIDEFTQETWGKCIVASTITYFNNDFRTHKDKENFSDWFNKALEKFDEMEDNSNPELKGPSHSSP